MDRAVRYKGQFIKEKVLAKKRQAIELGKCRKRRYDEESVININSGRRIVDLETLGKNLSCKSCSEILSLKNIVNERRRGLDTTLTVKCLKCQYCTIVPTGGVHKSHQDAKRAKLDINSCAVLGCIHSGIGQTALNKLLACLDIPSVSETLYKRYEREVGPVIEETAKDSCKIAAKEERSLVLKNIDLLCKELPKEISDEISANMKNIYNNPTLSDETNSSFDEALGNMVNIIVSYDMGWSKRGNGRSYDSLNGYGAIIGFLSGKVLDFQTRNRKCKRCEQGQSKDSHDCRLNFHGSAKAMESNVGGQLMNHSEILKDAGLRVKVYIGDEDSSTFAAVRRERVDTVFKLSDKTHLNKNFANDLYSLKTKFKEMRKKEVIPHLKKCFAYAIAQNKGNSSGLHENLKMIPTHVFGYHENCGRWCNRTTTETCAKQTILLKDPELLEALTQLFTKYANNSSKFSIAASSQANETINAIMAHKAPKKQCYSKSESGDYRYSSSVCNMNDGDSHVLSVKEKLGIPVGVFTEKFMQRLDINRSKKVGRSKLKSTKIRRNDLAANRAELRKKTEINEGIQYKRNSGFDNNQNDINDILDNPLHHELTSDSCEIVFFDLETSGFGKNADILQIAAKNRNTSFNRYVNPRQTIPASVSTIIGLENKQGELYLRGVKLPSVKMSDALIQFHGFLGSFGKPTLLVAHNAKFDEMHLMKAINDNNMTRIFNNVVTGFADSLSLLKKNLRERKGPGKFKLSCLAADFLPDIDNAHFHDATFDVIILEKLVTQLISPNDLFKNCSSYASYYINISLAKLKDVVSVTVMKKLVAAHITMEKLHSIFLTDGENAIAQIFEEKISKKKKVINDVIEFLRSNKQ